MANALQQKDRHVIPNFRGFAETAELGELDRAQIQDPNHINMSIEGTLSIWRESPSIGVAADLLSAATVAGETLLADVREAAKYLSDHYDTITFSQRDIVNRILENPDRNLQQSRLRRIKDFIDEDNRSFLHEKIHWLRRAGTRFARDPILFVELARYYSILGLKAKAEKNMLIAINMAPNNRYVIRSFARLFSHFNEIEFAYDFLKRSEVTRNDPWLLSAEISLAAMLERKSQLIKHAKRLIHSEKFSARSLAELSTAIGTMELLAGDRKKAKNLLNVALSDPNDNALAQVEWLLSKDRLFDIDVAKFGVKRSFEALARESFERLDWDKVIRHAEDWFMDMPFVRRPVLLAAHVASVALDDQTTAEVFCRAGLIAHPGDPLLLNNLAYSLALENRLDEARSQLDKVQTEKVTEESTRICLTATNGLIRFRERDFDRGRALYLEAIQSSSKSQNSDLYHLAIINYAREEILSGSVFVGTAIEMLNGIKLGPRSTVLKLFLDRVKALADKQIATS